MPLENALVDQKRANMDAKRDGRVAGECRGMPEAPETPPSSRDLRATLDDFSEDCPCPFEGATLAESINLASAGKPPSQCWDDENARHVDLFVTGRKEQIYLSFVTTVDAPSIRAPSIRPHCSNGSSGAPDTPRCIRRLLFLNAFVPPEIRRRGVFSSAVEAVCEAFVPDEVTFEVRTLGAELQGYLTGRCYWLIHASNDVSVWSKEYGSEA